MAKPITLTLSQVGKIVSGQADSSEFWHKFGFYQQTTAIAKLIQREINAEETSVADKNLIVFVLFKLWCYYCDPNQIDYGNYKKLSDKLKEEIDRSIINTKINILLQYEAEFYEEHPNFAKISWKLLSRHASTVMQQLTTIEDKQLHPVYQCLKKHCEPVSNEVKRLAIKLNKHERTLKSFNELDENIDEANLTSEQQVAHKIFVLVKNKLRDKKLVSFLEETLKSVSSKYTAPRDTVFGSSLLRMGKDFLETPILNQANPLEVLIEKLSADYRGNHKSRKGILIKQLYAGTHDDTYNTGTIYPKMDQDEFDFNHCAFLLTEKISNLIEEPAIVSKVKPNSDTDKIFTL